MFKSSVNRNRLRGQRTRSPRREERDPLQKSASIIPHGNLPAVSCTLRDINSTGARISVVSQNGIPEDFLLQCNSENLRTNAKVVWRRNNELGVRFLKT